MSQEHPFQYYNKNAMVNQQGWGLGSALPMAAPNAPPSPAANLNWQLLEELTAPVIFGATGDGKTSMSSAPATNYSSQQIQQMHLQHQINELRQQYAMSPVAGASASNNARQRYGSLQLPTQPHVSDTDAGAAASRRFHWPADAFLYAPPSMRNYGMPQSSGDAGVTRENDLFLQHQQMTQAAGLANVPAASTMPQTSSPGVPSTFNVNSSGSKDVVIRRCQGDDCQSDLSQAKRYYKRRKLCGNCISASSVVVGGVECRYCQQCSCLHNITDFDQARRSCRMKLEKHKLRARRARSSQGFPPARRASASGNAEASGNSASQSGRKLSQPRLTDPGTRHSSDNKR